MKSQRALQGGGDSPANRMPSLRRNPNFIHQVRLPDPFAGNAIGLEHCEADGSTGFHLDTDPEYTSTAGPSSPPAVWLSRFLRIWSIKHRHQQQQDQYRMPWIQNSSETPRACLTFLPAI